jgi:hypothetical protein
MNSIKLILILLQGMKPAYTSNEPQESEALNFFSIFCLHIARWNTDVTTHTYTSHRFLLGKLKILDFFTQTALANSVPQITGDTHLLETPNTAAMMATFGCSQMRWKGRKEVWQIRTQDKWVTCRLTDIIYHFLCDHHTNVKIRTE